MYKTKTYKYLFLIAFLTLVNIGLFGTINKTKGEEMVPSSKSVVTPTVAPEKDKKFTRYTTPTIEKKDEYTIFMLGDSMTYALGPHGGVFNEKINALYPGDRPGILIDNYSQSSTNILSMKDAMNKKITNIDVTFEPMLSRKADIILIESFGYNPLSQYTRDEGLKIQEKALDEIMQMLSEKYPDTQIIFVATISPNKAFYGTHIQNITAAERINQAEERVEFIKNHINYAKSHNIPLINIYEKSLTPDGDGNLEYINPDDFIHPSAVGVEFIGEEIAKHIYESKILPE